MLDAFRFARRFRSLLWKTSVEEEVDSELLFHIEMRTHDNLARGMTPLAARQEALRRFGDVSRTAASCRRIAHDRDRSFLRLLRLGELRQDARYALRQLGRSPVFTAVAVVTLALGIGATTAVFSVVNAVVLRPLPFPEPERLMRLWEVSPEGRDFSTSEPDYADWRSSTHSFAEMAAYEAVKRNLAGDGRSERVLGVNATATLFPLLGVEPFFGRVFTPQEDRRGVDHRVVVLSYSMWRRRFGDNRFVLGHPLLLDGQVYRVIGVMPPGFDFPDGVDLWAPLPPNRGAGRNRHDLDVVGRLRRGVPREWASADLTALAGRIGRSYPGSNGGWGVRLATFAEWQVGPRFTRRAFVFLGAVGLLWLLASVNVANLLLARATTRQREMDLRAALGAGRGRIARQLLTEGLVLATLGATAGLALAYGAVAGLRQLDPAIFPRLDEVTVDGVVLAVTLATVGATSLLFGLAPAAQLLRPALHEALRPGARGASRGSRRLRSALVVAEVAFAVVLTVGAGLMLQSFLRLRGVDPGFDPDRVLTLGVSLLGDRYPPTARRELMERVQRRLERLPGVVAIGATNAAPFSGPRPNIPFALERNGREGDSLSADLRSVTPGFFSALGIPVVTGRLLGDADVDGAPLVAVIDQSLALRFWPHESPIGQRLRWGDGAEPLTVVGVVGEVRDMELDVQPGPVVFVPYRQRPWRSMMLVVKTAGEPGAIAAAVRREIWAEDRDLPVSDLSALDRNLASAVAGPRFSTLLLALFAGVALLLAAVGVYGVTAGSVGERTHEIGVRLALGASLGAVLLLVLRQGAVLTGAGVGLGVAGALALARSLSGLLYDTLPTEAATYSAAALLLAVVTLVASFVPARRAARISPALALVED